MSSDKKISPGRSQENVRPAPSQIVRPRARAVADAEVRLTDDAVFVTVHAPSVSEKGLRYAIRRRYLLVWDERSEHDAHHLVLLPKNVDPADATVQVRNGVLDARIGLKKA